MLVPTGIAPHKTIAHDPGPEVRLELARRATEGDELIAVEPFEVEQARGTPEPSFTYRTLEALRERHGDAGLWLLMGCDAAVGLSTWREPARVLELASIGVAPRGGLGLGDVTESVRALSEDVAVEAIEMPAIAISSSLVRERARSGHSIRYLVPPGVERLIAEQGLYA